MLRLVARVRPLSLPFAVSFVALLAAGCDSTNNSPSDADAATGSAGADGGDASTGLAGIQGGDASGGIAGAHGGGTAGADGGSPDGGSADGVSHDLPNPAGRGPAPVELGATNNLAAPGSYIILAKTGITNATGSLITGGALGLSPAAASFITGFSLVADSTTTFSTSASVAAPGKVYASNYSTPTPTNLTTAVVAMQTAYTDAAGRSNPDFLNLASGNLGGLTLAPGLYKWSSAVTIPTDVTIAGGATDVWIFQVSSNLDVSAAKKVILSGGALARNVFWQVAGEVTIHATAHFEGVILSKTAITLQTTASMNGRLLAQSLVALDNNAITAP